MACSPLNFGGRTLETPCLDWLGDCKLDDWNAVREVLLLEHNALVRSLNQWNKLVGEGVATWTPLPTHAWEVYEESGATLEKYTYWLANIFSTSAPVLAMMQQAMAVHAAACDLDDALANIGQPVPTKPEKPDKPKTLAQEFVDFAKDTTKGVGMLAVVALATWAGVNYMRRGGK